MPPLAAPPADCARSSSQYRKARAAHPEAQVRFAQAHPYEAFEFIKATVSDVATFSPFEGKPPMNVHDFLGQRLAGMSLTYQVKDDSYRIA